MPQTSHGIYVHYKKKPFVVYKNLDLTGWPVFYLANLDLAWRPKERRNDCL
jgi:hypothetical protein